MSAPRSGSVKHVSSTANPLIKAVRALHQRKARSETGLFLAEGHKLIIDALAAGWTPTMIVAMDPPTDAVSELAARVRAMGADIVFATAAVMEKVARRENPQTVIGVFEQHLADPAKMPAGTIVALEGPRDPGNVGTIVRTADALGAAGVILIGASADPFGVETVRATMGSIFHVPLARMEAADFMAFAKRRAGPLVGTHLSGSVDIRTVEPAASQILLMGTEQSGLTPEMAAACDVLVRIPMAGKADSFNLAVATAIGLYELRRGTLPTGE